jgi:hypothetical protein
MYEQHHMPVSSSDPRAFMNSPQLGSRERQPEISEQLTLIEDRLKYVEEQFSSLIGRIESIMGATTAGISVAKDKDAYPIATKLGQRLYDTQQRLANLGSQIYHTIASIQL